MYKIYEYPNSARLIYKRMPGVSSISLGIWVNTGSRNEEVSINGISHFIEHLVFKGSRKYSGEVIKSSIEGVGGSLNAFTSEENTCYYAKFLSKHLKKVFAVLSDMVLYPLFKSEDIEKERTVILEEIKMYKDLPQFQVGEIFDALLWPAHPLGRNISGTTESVSGIERGGIEEYHRQWYGPGSLVVSCAGDIDEDKLKNYMEKSLFAGLKPASVRDIFAFSGAASRPQIKLASNEIQQTHLNLGFPALNRAHKDRFILGLMHVILGGNMSSRLFNEVREKKGLAYEIATHIKKLKDSGVFLVHAGVDRSNLLEACGTIFKEMDKLKQEKVSKDELRRAKDFYLAQSEMALDDTLDHMLWIGDSLTNLGLVQTKEELRRQIEKIVAEDILRVSRQIIDYHKLHFAAVGPKLEDIEPKLRAMVDKIA